MQAGLSFPMRRLRLPERGWRLQAATRRLVDRDIKAGDPSGCFDHKRRCRTESVRAGLSSS